MTLALGFLIYKCFKAKNNTKFKAKKAFKNLIFNKKKLSFLHKKN